MDGRRAEGRPPGGDDPSEAARGPSDATARAGSGRAGTVPIWSIERLTEGGREARIRHAGAVYLLRITSNGKLILTK